MSDEVKQFLEEWLVANGKVVAANKELGEARARLNDAASKTCEFQPGDRVRINGVVGQVTHVEVDVWNIAGPRVRVNPVIYPLKKDGTVSSRGRIYAYGRHIEKVAAND